MRAMKRLLLALPLLAAATSPPKPLTAEQQSELRCVAALAIVAHEQEAQDGEWDDLPNLAARGAHFAGVAGDRAVKASGQSRDAVREIILAEVAAFQKASKDSGLPRETVTGCIAMMDRIDPAPPPPGLVTCAALINLAHKEVETREGKSQTASRLSVYASLLEGQARDELRREGKTENEGDIVLGLERERILADSQAKQAKGENEDYDFEACFARANPPKEPHSKNKQH
jgi:hypothetical protein